MQYKITMGNDKKIRLSNPGINIYQGENNCDTMILLLPASYGETDFLSSCVLLNWAFCHHNPETETNENILSPDGLKGNIKELDLVESDEREGYVTTKIPISIDYTQKTGQIEFWIEVKAADKTLLKTNTVAIEIKDHISITEYVPKEQIDLLSDKLVQMQQLLNSCNLTLAEAKEEADRATTAAETIIKLMQEWEAEHGSEK